MNKLSKAKKRGGALPVCLNDLLCTMIGHKFFRLSDATECRDASIDGANIRFEYKNVFGWQIAWMPPDTGGD